MSNEQMAQSILQFTGGKENIRMVSNCMTRVRLEVNDPSVVQIDQIKALKGVFGVHVDAQVQVIVGPGTAAKVAACLQELLGDAHKAAGQADKETAQEIAARNKQVIKSRQKVSKGKLFLKTISNVFVPPILRPDCQRPAGRYPVHSGVAHLHRCAGKHRHRPIYHHDPAYPQGRCAVVPGHPCGCKRRP